MPMKLLALLNFVGCPSVDMDSDFVSEDRFASAGRTSGFVAPAGASASALRLLPKVRQRSATALDAIVVQVGFITAPFFGFRVSLYVVRKLVKLPQSIRQHDVLAV